MPEEAVLRIRFEGQGGQPTAVSVPRPTVPIPTPPPAKPAGAPPARPESLFESLLDIADQFRGVLGGVLGPLAGAALDAAAALLDLRGAAKPTEVPGMEPLAPLDIPPLPEGVPAPASTLPPPTPEMFEFDKAGNLAAPKIELPQAQPIDMPEIPPLPEAGAAEGAAGAEGAGAAAAVAGPAAVAVAAIAAFKELQHTIHDTAAGLGSFSASLTSADADPGKYTQNIGQAVSGVSDKLGLILGPVGLFGSALGGATEGLGEFMQAVDQVADRYAAYSPEVSVAEGMADVTQTLGDMRRAQEIGPELAEYIRARTDLQQKYEDLKVKILQQILPLAIDGVRILGDAAPLIEMILAPLTYGARGLDAILKWLKLAQEEKPGVDFDLPETEAGVLFPGGMKFNPEGSRPAPGL